MATEEGLQACLHPPPYVNGGCVLQDSHGRAAGGYSGWPSPLRGACPLPLMRGQRPSPPPLARLKPSCTETLAHASPAPPHPFRALSQPMSPQARDRRLVGAGRWGKASRAILQECYQLCTPTHTGGGGARAIWGLHRSPEQ